MQINLRTKLIIFSTLLVTIVMANVTYFYTIRELASKKHAVELQINRIARNIATMQLLDRQDWGVYQNYISQLMAVNEDIVYIAIYDARNSLRAHTINFDLVDIEKPLLTRSMQAQVVKRLDKGAIARASKDDLRTAKVHIQLGDRVLGSVHVGFSLIEINQGLQDGIKWNIVMALLFIFLFSIITVIISRRLTRPLERLNSAMKAIMAGNLEQKVEPETHDEIAQLAHTFNEMIEGLRERKIIENLGYELSAVFRFDRLAYLVRDRLKNAIGAADARLYIKKKDSLERFYEITDSLKGNGNYPFLKISRDAKSFVLSQKNGFMIYSAPDSVLQALRHKKNMGDGLVMPMTVKDQLFGFLFFALPSQQKSYDEKQRHFAAILSNQAALALENTILYEELREQERLKRELEIAREVQKKLLPAKMPEVSGYKFEAICQSAQEVGGDYFDFFQLDDEHIGIVIADVSGHGTSASFYMAEIKGMMLQLTSVHLSPKKLLIDLNHKLYGAIDRSVFVTMIYGVIHISSKTFTFARAGHNSLMKIGGNGFHQIFTPSGIGLGLDSGKIFEKNLEEVSLNLKRLETLVFYTDGITEARNERKQQFGEKRLLEAAVSQHNGNIVNMREGILNSLENFMNGIQAQDDITLVMVQCSE